MSRTTWDDLVFENRNKMYGAYSLRRAYSRTIVTAFAFALSILSIVMAFPAIKKIFEDEPEARAPLKKIRYTDLTDPPAIDQNKPIPEKIEIAQEVKKAIKFIPPKVTEKEVVEENVPTIDELKKNEVAPETTDGEGFEFEGDVVEEATQDIGEDPNKVWTIVEQPPEFPGGIAAMMKFLSQNTRYPSSARRMGTEGSVFVSFVVDPNGKITEVQTIKGIANDCDKEAMRVIQSMPPWKPGKQNGKPVRVRFVLPIKFVLGV